MTDEGRPEPYLINATQYLAKPIAYKIPRRLSTDPDQYSTSTGAQMSQFYIPSTSASATSTPAHTYSPTYSDDDNDNHLDDDDEDTLPYPADLRRNDFLAPDFDPQTYLSSLRNRHQTLQDLRSDLRQRGQLLNKELLDLVNGNYEDFLSLGGDLKGGEERVEGVRVGVLGFQREIEAAERLVRERRVEAGDLLREKKQVRRDVVLGRALLEVNERMKDLEGGLGLGDEHAEGHAGQTTIDEDEDDDESDEISQSDAESRQLRRLQQHARQYLLLLRLVERAGPGHPFILAQQARFRKVRKTLLLDLATALRQARTAKNPEATLAILRLYGDLDAESESVSVLQGS